MTIQNRLSFLADLAPPSSERTWFTAPHPNGRQLPVVATCGADKTVRVYSLVNFTLLSTVTGGHKKSVRTCAWKPDVRGESVLATGSFDATVGVWRKWDDNGDGENKTRNDDGEEGGEEAEEEDEWRFAVLLDGHDSEVKSVSWSVGGNLLATCSRDKSIWIWEDLEDGDNNFETVAVMQEHSGDVKCVLWHPTEECLASASYDDTIRIWREDIDDWGQVACLKGHEGTVWAIDWECADPDPTVPAADERGGDNAENPANRQRRETWIEQHHLSGPRLASCSDDKTVRIWKKTTASRNLTKDPSAVPSIIRPTGPDETWVEDAILPKAHDLPIYSVAWSKTTQLLASAGADGKIVVYRENFAAVDVDGAEEHELSDPIPSTWNVVAAIDAAHGVYEINHVAWVKRADRNRNPEEEDEEVLISAGDDGTVKVWCLQQGE